MHLLVPYLNMFVVYDYNVYHHIYQKGVGMTPISGL